MGKPAKQAALALAIRRMIWQGVALTLAHWADGGGSEAALADNGSAVEAKAAAAVFAPVGSSFFAVIGASGREIDGN